MTNRQSFLLRVAFVLGIFFLQFNYLVAQNAPFDCISAQLICEPFYDEGRNRSTTAGAILDEIRDDQTCMFDEDERGIVWYTFKVNNTGDFGFVITPNNPDDDYDWALFDLTNADCSDLATNPGDYLVSCNAAGGPDCHGATGMDARARYSIQGGGCDVDPPTRTAGFSTFNAFVPVQQGNTYVLAVQNWSFLGSGVFEGYTIDFSASINTGIIDTEAPVITEVVGGPSICDSDPIIVRLNENISCTNAGGITATLNGPNGETLTAQVFAEDCLRGATGVSELVLTADFRGATPGDWVVTLDDNAPNNEGLRDGCDNVIQLPISFDVFLQPDLSLNVNIQNRTPNNDVCAGETVTLRASETFDFLGTNHLYEWTRPDGTTFTGRDLRATTPGTYRVDVLQNGIRAIPGCRRGVAEFTIDGGVDIDLGPDVSGLCAGTPQTLTAQAGGNSYAWSNGQTGRTITVNQSGTYRVDVETDCGTVSDQINIEYDEIPFNLDATSVSTCPGDDITIGGASISGATYAWNTGETTSRIDASTAGTYTLNVTLNGCTDVFIVDVNASPIPDLNVFSNIEDVCPNGANSLAILTALDNNSTGASLRWLDDNSTSPSRQVGAGTYTVVATTAAGCTDTRSITIGTNTVTPATVNGQTNFNTNICAGETAFLIASAGNTYNWNTGATGNRIDIGAGNYSVTVTDNNGCESVANASINAVALPTITLASSLDCADDRSSYSFSVSTEADNTISTQGGVGTVTGSNGVYTISSVPEGQDLVVISTSPLGCESTQSIVGESCGCPVISAPNFTNNVPFCSSDASVPPLTVSANLAANEEVRWYNAPTGGTAIGTGTSLSVTNPGAYYAEVYNTLSDCPSQRIEVQLILNPTPSAIIAGDLQVCPPNTGAGTQLTATLASGTVSQVRWSNNATNASIMVTAAGVYEVTVTDQNGCEAFDSVTVGEFPTPAAVITGDFDFCPGETANLVASGGVSFAWNTNAPSSVIQPNAAGTYSVTVTDQNGCQDVASQVVSENAVPVITIPDGAESCADDLLSYDVIVNVFPEGMLIVNEDIGTVQGGGSSFVVEDVPAGEDITVTVTNNAGCTAEQFIAAVECECPVLAAPQSTGNVAICQGEPFPALSVSNASGGSDTQVRWYDRPTGGAVLSSGLNFTPSQAGTYYAEIINLVNQCTSQQRTPISLTINQPPVATIGGVLEVCPGGETTLNAGNASAYTWSGSANDAATRTVQVRAGTYSVTIIDANGCQAEDEVTVTEFAVAQASITGDLSVCPDESTELRASGGQSYQWSNFALSDRVTVGTGTYSVTVTDANACESVATATVTEDALPPLSLIGAADCSEDLETYSINISTAADVTILPSEGVLNGANISNITGGTNISVTVRDDNTGCETTQSFPAPDCECPAISAPSTLGTVEVCEGQPLVPISVSNAGVANDAEVRWYTSATGGTEIAVGTSFTPSAAGTYFAEVYNLTNNCTSVRTAVELVVNPTPVANIAGANEVCPDQVVELTASLANGTASSFTWSDNTGNANQARVSVGAGVYTVTVVDANGCETTQTTTVTEYSVQQASISGDNSVCPDETTTLEASGGAGFTYNWNNFAQSDRVNVPAGDYSVTVTDPNGCESVAMETVSQDALPEFTLVDASLRCADDLNSYQLQISTAAGNELMASLGTVSGAGGFFTIEGVDNEIPISITVTDPVTGCSDFAEFTAPNCNCPVVSAPQDANNIAICLGDAAPVLSVSSAGVDSDSEIRWYSSATANAEIARGLTFTPSDATTTRTYFAEIYNTLTDCTSPRTPVTLTVNAVPNASITGMSNVCPGEETQLSASLDAGSAQTFAWSASAGSASTASVTVGNGLYSVTITDANGCVAEATRTIETYTVGQVSIDGDLTVCPDASTELTAIGSATYEWSNLAQTATISVKAGTYTVVATDTNGCESTDNVTVTQDALPTISLVNESLACAQDLESYGLQISTEAGNELMASAGTVTGTGGFFTIEGITSEMPVTITVTNPNTTCEDSQQFDAPDCNCPVLSAPQGETGAAICVGDAVPALTVSGAGVDSESEIRWYATATGGDAISIGTSFTPSDAATQTYFAEIYNTTTNCTSPRTPVTLTVNELPSASITGQNQVCPDGTTELSASIASGTAQSFEWSNGEQTPNVMVGEGDYTVIITDANGCVGQATEQVGTFTVAPISIDGDLTVCLDATTELTASGAATYEWNTFDQTATITVEAGTYTVTATDANGCESVQDVTVTQDALPTITLVDASLACATDLESYGLQIVTEAGNELTSSLGTVTGTGGLFTISGAMNDIPVTVTVTNPVTGCTDTQQFTAPNCNCPVLSAPQPDMDLAICAGDAIPELSVLNVGVDEESEIRWYTDATGGTSIASGLSFTPITATETRTYFAEIYDISTNCTSPRTPVTLTVNALPTADIAGTLDICPSLTTELTVNLTDGGTAQSYLWSSNALNATTETVSVGVGIYTVTITDQNSCETTATAFVNEFPAVTAAITGDNTVCPGETTELTASGGISFEWSDFTQSATATLGVGDYSVTVTDANGCTGIATIEVTEDVPPSLTLSSSAACADDLLSYSLEIITEAGNTVSASQGTVNEAGGIASITELAPDTPVTVTVTNPTTGCTTEQSFTAPNCNCPEFSLPVVIADVSICAGDDIPALTATSTDLDETRELRWYDADIDGNVVGTGAEFTPNVGGTYYVEVFEMSSGCSSARIPVTLTINDLPEPSIIGEAEICPDATTSLTATGGTSFAWASGETTASIDVAAGDYSVVVTDANNCSAEVSFSVANSTLAPASIAGTLGVCPDETTVLTASDGTSFQWDNGETSQSIEVGAGTYTVLVSDANGCVSPATVDVLENQTPNFAVPQAAACSPDLLSYGVQLQTELDNVVTADVGMVNDLGGGLWEIIGVEAGMMVAATITDPNTNCTTVAEFPAPNCDCPSLSVPVSGGDATICSGEAIPALSVSEVDEGLIVNWYDAPVGGNIVGTGVSLIPSEAGTYHAAAVEEASGCTSLRTAVSLTINQLPEVSIAASAAGACGNDLVTLTASGAMEYTWSSGEASERIEITPGTYTVTGVDENACSNTATQVIAAFPTPNLSVDNTDVLCGNEFDMVTASGGETYVWSTGETTSSVQLGAGEYSVTTTNAEGCTDEVSFTIAEAEAASADLGADQTLCGGAVELSPGTFTPGVMAFEWSNGSTGETLVATQSGIYRVTVTDACGGEAVSSVTVENLTSIDTELLEMALGPDTTNCLGQLRFDVSGLQLGDVGDVSFRWQDKLNSGATERFVSAESGIVTLTATNECGTVSASVEIAECEECNIYAPNTFSPDGLGDLNNEEFKLYTNCELTNYNFKIYDRWGSLLFETQELEEGWDGKFKDDSPVSGSFVWMVSYDIVDRYGTIRTRIDSGTLTIQR